MRLLDCATLLDCGALLDSMALLPPVCGTVFGAGVVKLSPPKAIISIIEALSRSRLLLKSLFCAERKASEASSTSVKLAEP